MSEQEAQTFFNEYVGLRAERISALRSQFQQDGARMADALNLTPESLCPLWRWVMPRLRTREFTPEELKRIMSLPEKFRRENLASKPFSYDTCALLNDVAYYFAEVVIRNLTGVYWTICRTKVSRYVDKNQPVLGGFSTPGFEIGVNPREWVTSVARQTLEGKTGENGLLDLYGKCCGAKKRRRGPY